MVRFAIKPTPFAAFVHTEPISVPLVLSTLWGLPQKGTSEKRQRHPGNTNFAKPEAILVVKVFNQGPSVRHHVRLQVDGVLTFSGAALGLLGGPTEEASSWQSPAFRENDSTLVFPPIPLLASQANFQVFVWGSFRTIIGPQTELFSDEGSGSIVEEELISGWPLALALNAWWIATIVLLGMGIFWLWRFEKRR